jgi:hypothetical protein
MNRFFRSYPETYESIRGSLDSAWGYPNEATKTVSSLPLPSSCPSDALGRVYIAADADYCEYVLPSQMLPQLIESGLIEEITEAEYVSVLPAV